MIRDIIVLVGAMLIGYGAWEIHPPMAKIIIGMMLLGLGLWGTLRARRMPK